MTGEDGGTAVSAVQAPQGGDLNRRLPGGGLEAALGRAALALNSRLDLDEVLEMLGREILAHTRAHRASVLLCDPDSSGAAPFAPCPPDGRAPPAPEPAGVPAVPAAAATPDEPATPDECGVAAVPHRLMPAVSLAREPDAELWHAFREAEPIELDDVQRRAFARARVVALPDASASELIPAGWARRFDLHSVVLVPLFSRGEPCGLLVADYPRRQRFDDIEFELLGIMGELAGVAVANARLLERTRRRARLRGVLARTSAELSPPLEQLEIARRLAAALSQLLDAEVVGIGRVETDGLLRPLVATGGHVLPAPRPLAEVPERIVERVEATWHHGVTRACPLPADRWLLDLLPAQLRSRVGGFVLLPLLARGRPVAAVLVARAATGPPPDDVLAAAETLAVVGGVAMERRELLDRNARRCTRLEVVDRLLEDGPERTDAEGLRAALQDLLAPNGVEIVSLAFRDRFLRRRLGGAEPSEVDRRLWARVEAGGATGDAGGDGAGVAAADAYPDEDARGAAGENGAGEAVGPVADDPEPVLGPRGRDRLLGHRVDERTLALVLWCRDEAVGTVHVRPAELDRAQVRLLEAVAAVVGRLAVRRAYHEEAERLESQRVLDEERARLAAALQDRMGTWVQDLGGRAMRLADQLPFGHAAAERAGEVGRLAAVARRELAESVRMLANEPTTARGLSASLEALAASISHATALDVEVAATGGRLRLPLATERLLYRVACETFAAIWRASRPAHEPAGNGAVAAGAVGNAAATVNGAANRERSGPWVRCQVQTGRRRESLTIAADGINPEVAFGVDAAELLGVGRGSDVARPATPSAPGANGLTEARQQLEEADGGLDVASRGLLGLSVHAWVPRELEKPLPGGRRSPSDSAPYGLTPREAQVLGLVADGLNNQEIAQRLALARNTVKSHVSRLLDKLAVADRWAAAHKARTEGLVAPLEPGTPPATARRSRQADERAHREPLG